MPVRRQAAARVSGNGGRAGRVSWIPVDAGGDPGAAWPGERGVDSGAAGDGDALLAGAVVGWAPTRAAGDPGSASCRRGARWPTRAAAPGRGGVIRAAQERPADALPLDPATLGSLAVLGPNAHWPVIHGGGSAVVSPVTVSTPAAALRRALAGRAAVTCAPGCTNWVAVPGAAARLADRPADRASRESGWSSAARTARSCWPPSTGTPRAGLVGSPSDRIDWGEAGQHRADRHRSGPDADGPHVLGAGGVGPHDHGGRHVVAEGATAVPDDPVEAMTRPGEIRATSRARGRPAGRDRLAFRPRRPAARDRWRSGSASCRRPRG